MPVDVMIEVAGKIGREIVGHAVKFLKSVKKIGGSLIHRFNAHDRPGFPRDILRKFDQPFLDDRCDTHTTESIFETPLRQCKGPPRLFDD
jgi:hypothetical protein